MPARYHKAIQSHLICACSGSDTDCHRGSSLSGKFAVFNRDIVCVIIFSCRIGFARSLCARYVNERIIVRRRIISKLDVLDKKHVSIIISAVSVDIQLTGNGLAVSVKSKVQARFLMDHRYFFDVGKQHNRHIACLFMRRIQGFLEGFVLDRLIARHNLRYRANEFAIDIRIAFVPDVRIIRELCHKLIPGDRFPSLRAIIEIEVERGSLRINVKLAVKGAVVELRVHIGGNAVITAVALAELAVRKGDLLHAAVRGPAMEFAAAYRDRAAVAAVDIERIDRIDLRVFDHKIRIAALTQHTAESTGNIGILYSKGGRSIDSIHQDRGVPGALSAAAHHDTVDHTAVSLYVNDGIVSAARNSTAIDLEILDRDIRICKLHAIAIRGRDLDRGRVSALALQRHARRNDCCRRQFDRTRVDDDRIAGLRSIQGIRQAHIFHVADRRHARDPRSDIFLLTVHVDNDLPAVHRPARNTVVHLNQAADHRKRIRFGRSREVLVDRVIAQVYGVL